MLLKPELTDKEARVIGCLIEKSVITPDQYPLTLNALTNACNQKSSRDPVMSLTPGEVQHAANALRDRHLVMVDENIRGRVQKYSQRLCNTRYSELQFDAAELAIVCLLLLRGPQTPGELKSRAGRLYHFRDPDEVIEVLERLAQHAGGPLAVRLPKRAGRRDAEYAHTLGADIPPGAGERQNTTAPERRRSDDGDRPGAQPPGDPDVRPTVESLLRRIEALERAVAELQAAC